MIWYDYYYFILVIPAVLLSLIAQAAVKGTYRSMSRVQNRSGLTGAAAAARVLSYYGITNVRIEPINGNLTDHYDPRDNVIRLSSKVFSDNSIASVGIACHEAGHAAQHAQGYAPIKVRNAILPVANIGSSAGILLAVLGYVLGFGILTKVGIILFAFTVFFACGMIIAARADSLGRMLAYGMSLLVYSQALINLWVVTGCAPTKGIALPFISYGGTNLLTAMIAVGFLFNVGRQIGLQPPRPKSRISNV